MGLIDVRIESGPELRDERFVWIASADELFGSKMRVILVVWYCPDEDLSFLAFYTGAPEHDVEEVVAPML
jgi:hypothetical protein